MPARPNPIPLPAAVLALSVAVCIGSTGTAGAAPFLIERASQAEQRETIEHLIEVLQQAAKKLSDRLVGQASQGDPAARDMYPGHLTQSFSVTDAPASGAVLLREALLNLPPPTR